MRRAAFLGVAGAGALAGLLIAYDPALAHQRHASGGATHAGTTMDAKTFVDHATQTGLTEVELGKLAADRAASPDVKQFGQRMVEDHSKAGDELAKLASSKGITAPTEVTDPKHRALIDRLEKLSGREFDRAYMQAMVSGHDHAVGAFKTYAQRGDDGDIKAWAQQTLPTLEEHERLAKKTAATVAQHASKGHPMRHASAGR